MTYSTYDVPVRGGSLRVGEWNPGIPAAPTLVAAHGVTASHLAWAAIADALPEVRVIAPDLRGRGRSSTLPGPFGMAQHAQDLAAVSEALELGRTLLTGHSMGGFVALVTAHLYPERFAGPLLIDGGLPLAIPAGVSADELLQATLGPAARRLEMTFPSEATYLDFWKQHPAFTDDWNDAVVAYASYDLTGSAPELRSSASFEAVKADSAELYGGGHVLSALAALDHPIALLTAPRGLLNETPGLYSTKAVERWRAELPLVTITEVPNVNHYTIVMGEAGANAVAREVRRELAGL